MAERIFNWIHNILNDNEISENDIKEGFPLLQVLSLLSPASVDLNWYTTSDALECPNIALRNYGIKIAGKFVNSDHSVI
jgi:hypothetical protein